MGLYAEAEPNRQPEPTALFPEPRHPRTRPLGDSEPVVNWLKQSTRAEAIEARRRVNEWYAAFPDYDGSLAQRLRIRKNPAHLGAMDELYAHQLLRKVTPDARYEEGGRGPDFRCYREGREFLALEVASLFESEEWAAGESCRGRLYDYLNTNVRANGYLLGVSVLKLDAAAPLAPIAAFAQGFIGTLPEARSMRALLEATGRMPEIDYRASGVLLRLTAIPIPDSDEPEDPDERIVAAKSGGVGWVVADTRLKRVLHAKHPRVRRYTVAHGVPYVISVGIHDVTCSRDEIMKAVYGAFWQHRDARPPYRVRPDDFGFFSPTWITTKAQNTSVSAVMTITQPRPIHLDSIECLLLPNPHASAPIGGLLDLIAVRP